MIAKTLGSLGQHLHRREQQSRDRCIFKNKYSNMLIVYSPYFDEQYTVYRTRIYIVNVPLVAKLGRMLPVIKNLDRLRARRKAGNIMSGFADK
jgi:hypothetical protein